MTHFVRHSISALLVSALCVMPLCAQTASPAPAAAPADVQSALTMLHDRGNTLQDFTATLRKEDITRTGDREVRKGSAAYQKDDDITNIGLHFDSVAAQDVPTRTLDEDAVVLGRLFIHRDANAKTYDVKELAPPGEHFNPLKIGVGPFPLPIGQDPAEMWREFNITQEPIDPKQLPPNYKPEDLIHLHLVPRTENKYNFKSADLYIDPKLQIPIKISTIAPDDAQSSLTLSNLQINQGAPKLFTITEPPANTGWTTTFDPYKSNPSKPDAK